MSYPVTCSPSGSRRGPRSAGPRAGNSMPPPPPPGPMIDPDTTALLGPLERFEAIRRRVVRLGPRLCDLSYANPYGGAQQAALAALKEALEDRRRLDLQYSPFGG